ncbi:MULTISPECIES: amidase [Alteromonadaceae]|uniref:amidase n=1 Tax=Alteromonadaceae TaxID=72275 RepID=UPI001C083D9F|nr:MULTISPECIES: amidase [Aliiglaciecola]MBU2880141.1 amidase [Aliiglaciecola lipolytica]MDO6710863.1 amidase [Aliiglaciecola sp. 2_MG-2023]MDO6752344.1 amidase [Aliiglaciecola sp. 1_MG-2023]
MCVFTKKFEIGTNTQLVAGIKDNIDVAGFVTEAGSKAFSHNTSATKHADVVATMLASGVKLVGKLNMHELAYGMTGVNSYLGTPVNYLYPEYIPGGSSSGCAVAVAEMTVDFSIGTDTGGSIRVPAACCGVFGFKPTFGRVSRKGVVPAESTLDCVGPLAFSAEDLIKGMQCIDPTFAPISIDRPIKLARLDVAADSLINQLVDKALNQSFIELRTTTLAGLNDAFDAALKLMNFEMWQTFGHLLNTGKLGSDIESRLLAASQINPNIASEAEVVRAHFSQQVDDALKGVDALVLPTLPSFPLKRVDGLEGKNDLNISFLTRPFNLSGHPAITIPLKNELGKPVGMQLVGAKGNDELICEIAKKLSCSNNINTECVEKNDV